MKERKKPNFTGVPGELVDLASVELRPLLKGKKSPYDDLLRKLSTVEGVNRGLKFGSVRAKNSVLIRAKKLGYRVSLFDDAAGNLYVKFGGFLDTAEVLRGRNREAVRKALANGHPLSPIAIASWCRENGAPDMDAGLAKVILSQMKATGEAIEDEIKGTWKAGRKP